jgi:hypothetical protein
MLDAPFNCPALELWRKTAQGNSGKATRASLMTFPLLLCVTKKFDRTILLFNSFTFTITWSTPQYYDAFSARRLSMTSRPYFSA